MTTAPPESKPTRRGVWLAVAVVVGLLALSTWDALRNSGRSSPAALRRAAFDGDEATVRRIIAAHPEWIDLPGSTNGQTRVLGGLYEKAMKGLGKSPSAPSSSDPEHYFQQLERLGANALFHAVAKKHIGTAMILVEAGANPRMKLSTGESIVPMAAYVGDTKLMSALERRGANLNELQPGTGMTALHQAAYGQRPEMLLYLLGRGLSVNSTNRGGVTPLHIVAGHARLDFVQILVTNGADLTLTNRRGDTALDAARLRVLQGADSKAVAVVTWLEDFAATNQPPAKPAP
ncbi:MAG: ankyrin repeat domain-containing protein [Limisphaerales bacterium]